MPGPISFNLDSVTFGPAETVIAKAGSLTASVFCYGSGLKALRIRNKVGEIICLPYQGQQIADAMFHGRRLTMRSMFGDPMPATHYLGNSGGFLVHCGATAMGNPSTEDTHPLHGELPNLPYQTASIVVGKDERGTWMGLTGVGRYTIAFTHSYESRPLLKLHEDDGRIDAELEIINLKHTPMELMYLAHVNFRPHDGARLIDTAPDDPLHIRIRRKVPQGLFKPTEAFTAMLATMVDNPGLHRDLVPGRAVDPEIVMGLTMKPDADGWGHAMQLLPDGTADYISHRLDELPSGVRWMTRNADQDALGLFLPGTAEADGYLAEKAKGNVKVVPPQQSFRCHLSFGALTQDEAEEMQARIAAVMA
ncbi:DUF4432 family protein [Aestuariivirga sp.]|uniref:DUF4432 family protein n=1 Tax=Aestuariivirga sp. TaxID=2650926 RepID=UPI00359398BA